ncbi:hypothetical protein Mal15_53790 [Stieleria maiorica]|uniref:Uncharacterized protein n=1 Tax=Stieleria maiorica TaxID=2795974 RepID=A0A5B9MIV9_9BACT|nr:hypothetical protein [Stieleria maiorica]QEG01303.1 hypothetical protein Mal15_53790 [Stieleria maiorica]
MKIDRHDPDPPNRLVKHCFTTKAWRRSIGCVLAMLLIVSSSAAQSSLGQQSPWATESPPSLEADLRPPREDAVPEPRSEQQRVNDQQRAAALIDQVIDRLANGAAFDCKVRQRVRTAGREVLGVGTYLQVGGGSGQFSFQIEMHDGDGKHRLQQISDGRLAWTRTQIAGVVSLSRVDVGWLDEGARTLRRNDRIKPSMMVGGPSEMLDSIRRDYDLKLGKSSLSGRPLLVVIGTLKQSRRDQIGAFSHDGVLPPLFPTRVNVAIAQDDDPEIDFGKGLPVRIEHFSDPIAEPRDAQQDAAQAPKRRQMISLLEFYSIRPVAPPPIQRFRFENQDTEIDFVNETGRYENRFNIRVSAKERQRYR